MNKRTFKSGDVVRIRQWDDMEREFGLNCFDGINCKFGFLKHMKELCGLDGLIIDSVGSDNRVTFKNYQIGWSISTDMIERDIDMWKHDDAIDAYTFVGGGSINKLCVDDLKITDCGELTCEFDKDSYDKIVKGLWEAEEYIWETEKEEEEKEGNKMELVKIYEEKALKVILDAKEKEIKERIKNNPIIKKYNELVDLFEKASDELYASQKLSDSVVLTEVYSDNMFKYGVSNSYLRAVEDEVDDKYSAMKTELNNRLREVNAQLELYERMPAEDAVLEIQTMLVSYGILNQDGTVATYTLPEEKCDCENCKDCEKVPGGETKKRGRKKKSEK